jgi:transcriptional regulator GlxA family with amidase domain
MIRISLLTFNEVVPTSVAGAIDLITGANKYLEQIGKTPVFNLELVGEKAKKIIDAFHVSLKYFKTYEESGHPDLIIIPAFNDDSNSTLSNNRDCIQWLKEMRRKGTEIASLCVGCYFLAEAGLLNGKEATSHWASMDDLKNRYPQIILKSDVFITDHDGIYTSGGGISSLKLILYLIEKFCGRELALCISKLYTVEIDRTNQSHFAVFMGQRQHGDKEILSAQLYIEQHYREEMSIDSISILVNMGRRNFIRRFKAATTNTPFEYIQRVRIESAKKAIETNEKDLSTIVHEAGYADAQTFRSIFKRITSLSPQEYRKKYARISVGKIANH